MVARLKAVAASAFVLAALTGLATVLAATGIGGDAPRPSGSRADREGRSRTPRRRGPGEGRRGRG